MLAQGFPHSSVGSLGACRTSDFGEIADNRIQLQREVFEAEHFRSVCRSLVLSVRLVKFRPHLGSFEKLLQHRRRIGSRWQ